jgi:DNA repair photolyase
LVWAQKGNSILSTVPLPIHGRGASDNPPNRFESLRVEDDFEHVEGDEEFFADMQRPRTEYFVDNTRSIIARNDSPDVGFSCSINPYRGCSHGCIYCYARPTHEYLGFSAGLDFETKILVKRDAADLLRRELSAKKWRPETLSIGGVTDPYQPAERHFKITRQCIEVLLEFRNPLAIVTKNHLVTRDIDLLSELATKYSAAAVFVSVTTLDAELAAKMEPQTSTPRRRLEAIERLTAAGIPVGVMVAPCIPGLTDHEMSDILSAAARAGARAAGFVPVRLPGAVAPLFEKWLEQHFPDRKDKVLNRIRSLRGGKLNDPNFGSRMHGEGVWSDQLKDMFQLAKRRAGLNLDFPELSGASFRVPPGPQLTLW